MGMYNSIERLVESFNKRSENEQEEIKNILVEYVNNSKSLRETYNLLIKKKLVSRPTVRASPDVVSAESEKTLKKLIKNKILNISSAETGNSE